MGRPQPLVAKWRPSGATAIDDDMAAGVLHAVLDPAGGRLDDVEAPVQGGDEVLSVRGEGRRAHHHRPSCRARAPRVAIVRRDAGRPHGVLGDELARLDVPDPQVEIVAPGEQSPAARPEADRPVTAEPPCPGSL